MRYDIITVPCLEDNYAYLVADKQTRQAILIDAPEAAPINKALKREKLTLTTLLLTHHHWDHVEGIDGLDKGDGFTIVGCAKDADRLPKLDQAVSPGDVMNILGTSVQVMAADGHTINHIAFYMPELTALFSGDSLMTHGCGRLFEGTPQQMFETVQGFAALPDNTKLYCGHNYADANLEFAAHCSPDPRALSQRKHHLNTLADENWPTTGVTLALEKQINPYLRTHLPQVKAAVGMPDADDAAVFAEIRARKDKF
ncbi:hydroxyacylglutathione hydrolase [Yoonia sp. 208BN28-4]|uniref:hydroxyacylglutathione hydrolase n=1 Tax=Yoonia sp. 208BN28-4 TaxID=3126505 RepID=UPI00309706FE